MPLTTKNVSVYFCRWIDKPHDKIALCFCDQRNFLFWFNSEAAYHGIAQMQVAAGEAPAITKDCFLDLSGAKGISEAEIAAANHRGPISDAFAARISAILSEPVATLPESHRQLALKNLS